MRRGKIFYAGDLKVLGLYSQNPGVVYETPPGTIHLAHATYPFKKLRRNIDYFLVREELPFAPQEEKHINGDYDFNGLGIHLSVARPFSHLGSLLCRIAAFDIRNFYRERRYSAKESSNESTLTLTDKFAGPAHVLIEGAHVDITGKQDFYPECAIDLNLDFANWCVSGVTRDSKLAPWMCCGYCYSAYTHKGFPYVFRVDKQLVADGIRAGRAKRAQDQKPTRYMRLGKRTEAGAPFLMPQLCATLEACINEKIKCIFPTKFLEFDAHIADLLKQTDSTLLISLGIDEYEKGACLWGRTQEVRIEHGLKFKEAGVRVAPYLIVNPADPFSWPGYLQRYNELKEKFGTLQLLPLRIRYSSLGNLIGGWHNAVASVCREEDLFGEKSGGFFKARDGTRLPGQLHPSLVNEIGENKGNVRMCSHGCDLHCGKCFMPGENGVVIANFKYQPVKTNEGRG